MLMMAVLMSGLSYAQIESSISGLVFADYYYTYRYHDSAVQGRNAFNFRRIYFTFESTINKNIKIRFRLESAHEKFGSATKINPFVKHAYLEWDNLIPHHQIYLGLTETNALKNSEEYWGYRSIEKTIMDLNKISSSADMGIAVKGDITGFLHHWLTIFNGTGYGSSEVDKYKKVGYALWITPLKGFILEGYADYEKQDPETGTFEYAHDFYHSSGYTTFKGFVGYSHAYGSLGVEAFLRTNMNSGAKNVMTEFDAVSASYRVTAAEKTDVRRFGISTFLTWITPVPKVKMFVRYDYFDRNLDDNVVTAFNTDTGILTGGSGDEQSTFFAGLDFIPASNVHLMPNIIYTMYSQDGKNSDVIARVTLYYKFNSGKIIVD